MNEPKHIMDEMSPVLRDFITRWSALAQEAEQRGRQLSVGNVQQALYQRGIAEGLRTAIKDLVALLQQDVHAEQPEDEAYTPVSRDEALALLGKIGLHITELHQHADHTFSAMLAPLQVLTFEERVHKLSGIADVVILAKGRLSNSSKAYIDFAFRKPTS